MKEAGKDQERATWTDNVKYIWERWRVKEAGEDKEPHGQTKLCVYWNGGG